MNLYYFKSSDLINCSKGEIILRPSINSWDNRGIYKSSILFENNTYYIFYSGIGNDMKRGIGITSGGDIKNIEGVTIDRTVILTKH